MAAATDRPEAVVGWHWASPAPVMRFAEIVRTRDTATETVDTVRRGRDARAASTRSSSATPTPRGGSSRTGSTGRCCVEAQRVVHEGVATAEEVDQLMMDCFRVAVGPFGMVRGAAQRLDLSAQNQV